MIYAGIDLGGTNTKIGIVDEKGEILIKTTIKTLSENGIKKTMTRIWNEVVSLCRKKDIDEKEILGIGMGIPGPVIDQEVVGTFANFPWKDGINVREVMEKISRVETRLENDVNIIAIGEAKFGAGRGIKNSITVALGTGIGGGIIVNNNLISGITGAGGEIGHMKIVEEGKLCGCGQRGCFEAYASATGIIREGISRLSVNKENMLYEKINGKLEDLSAKDVFDCAKEGDKFSLEIVDYTSNYLAMGIGNLLNIINPEIVVLSGGVALAGDILINKVIKSLEKYAMPVVLKKLEIKQGILGNDAGVKGSVALFIK